jgi:hypothetical protein
MADLKQALKWIIDGHKVTRTNKDWEPQMYIRLSDEHGIVNEDDNTFPINQYDVGNDWILWEDKDAKLKELKDKIKELESQLEIKKIQLGGFEIAHRNLLNRLEQSEITRFFRGF